MPISLFSSPTGKSKEQEYWERVRGERDDITAGVMTLRGLLGGFSEEEKLSDYQKEMNVTKAILDANKEKWGGLPSTAEHLDQFESQLRDYKMDAMADRLVGARLQDSIQDILSEVSGGGKPKTTSLATLSEAAGNVEQVIGSMQTRAQEEDWFGITADEFRDEDRPKIEGAINLLTQTPGLEPIEQQTLLQSAVGRTGGLFGTGLFEDLQFDYDTFLKNYNQFTQQKGLTRSSGRQAQPQPQQVPQNYNPFRR